MFDILPFNDELDQLEIRLNELNTVDDTFVIIESAKTFPHMLKPLYYLINKDRFLDFQSKIIHIVLPPMPDKERMRTRGGTYSRLGWQEEVFERNWRLQLAFEMDQPNEDDWFMTRSWMRSHARALFWNSMVPIQQNLRAGLTLLESTSMSGM